MNRLLKYAIVIVLVLLLILIRYFEDALFYDPYLEFFKNDYLYIDSPRRETFKLVMYTSFRFLLNTIISIGILFLAFKSKSVMKFSIMIYVLSYLFLLAAFLFFVVNPKQEDYYLFFNIRRFLIQPIILLVLLPAFYYHKLTH